MILGPLEHHLFRDAAGALVSAAGAQERPDFAGLVREAVPPEHAVAQGGEYVLAGAPGVLLESKAEKMAALEEQVKALAAAVEALKSQHPGGGGGGGDGDGAGTGGAAGASSTA